MLVSYWDLWIIGSSSGFWNMCKTYPSLLIEPCLCLFYNSVKVAKEKGIDVSAIVPDQNGEKAKKSQQNQSMKHPADSKTQATGNHSRRKDEPKDEMNLLQLLALNALDLTAPAASDLLIKNRKNAWIQLSGHEGAFSPAGPGTIWKRRPANDDTEVKAYRALKDDIMKDMVPKFYKEVEYKTDYYIEMQDLLSGFNEPSVMDIKMGTRTFTEGEVKNQIPRPDLYKKMISVDPNSPTTEERQAGAITKLRYMEFREQHSSSSTMGFRIEAVKYGKSTPIKDLKLVKTREQIKCTLRKFFEGRETSRQQIISRLKIMRKYFEQSKFCNRHEIIGSSILLIHDGNKAGAWIIDFAKTIPLPEEIHCVSHRKPWICGNHEDGYLTGLDSLINVIELPNTP